MNDRNAEPQEVMVCAACQLVPISLLSLDHSEPTSGWEAMLAARGIELIEDDLGRMAIRREDARALMGERRGWELASAEEKARRQEEAARNSRPVPPGIPRPAGADAALSAYEVMRGADADAEQSDPARRLTPQEEFLKGSFGQPVEVVAEEER
jgi:hypothetical protein